MKRVKSNQIIQGDALLELKKLPNDFVDTIITSPPYWGLRDYGVEGQLGLEKTLDEYLNKLLEITTELKRVLKPTGVMFWNHGDSYFGGHPGGSIHGKITGNRYGDKSMIPQDSKGRPQGHKRYKRKEKCLIQQNYRLILKMIDHQGWILRNTIIWHKPNHMPSSVKDRFTNSYEPVFMLVKRKKYWFDLDAVRKPQKQISLERMERGVSNKHKYSGGAPGQILHRGLNSPRLNIKQKPYAVQERIKPFVEVRDLPDIKEFSTWLNNWRKEQKITIDEIETRMDSQAPHHWFNGEAYPSVKDWWKFKKLYKSPIKYDKQLLDITIESSGKQNNPAGKNPGDVWNIPLSPKYEGTLGHSKRQGLQRPLDYVTIKAYKEYQEPIANFLKANIRKEHKLILDEEFGKHKWRHWIRTDMSGAALPGVEDWQKLKEIIGFDDSFDSKIYEIQKLNIPVFQSGRNPSDVWKIPTQPLPEAHFATFPEKLIEPMILSSCPKDGLVLDPFIGSGTVAVVAKRNMRNYLGIELNKDYIKIAQKRIRGQPVPLL